MSDKCGYTCRIVSTVSIRELSRNASGVVAGVAASGRPAVVTRHGVPVAAVVPIDAGDLEDLVLAKAPRYLEDIAAADEDLREGRTRSANDVFADLGV
jgi:prevent-host-death family protein